MFERVRTHWRKFRADPAGRRFMCRYERRNVAGARMLRKVLVITGGLALIAIGIVMLVLPGPGLLVMLIGAGLVAEESLFAANWLDRIDLWLSRQFAGRGRTP